MNRPPHPKAVFIALGAACVCMSAAGGRTIDARIADDLPDAAYTQSLAGRLGIGPSEKSLEKFLRRSVTVSFSGSGADIAPVVIRIADHPEWIAFDDTYGYIVDERVLRLYLEDHPAFLAQPPAQAVATDIRPNGAVIRADVAGTPAAGFTYDTSAAARAIVRVFHYSEPSVTVALTRENPVLFVRTASGTVRLQRLSQGKSDFAHSPYGRRANVIKALHERLQGVVIAPGERFSFTNAMDGAVGWSNALVIVNGGELASEPGGGICQAATTAFRAALLAGLPVPERANHSLYVSYYKAFGVGIDATYYPGKQDLVFTNDTGDTIVMLARHEGDQAIVELYGTPDGRAVKMDGPYIGNAGDVVMDGETLRINQIGWTYDVAYPDGRIVRDRIVSTYKALPRRLAEEFPVRRGIAELLVPASAARLLSAMTDR